LLQSMPSRLPIDAHLSQMTMGGIVTNACTSELIYS
jgi:hypothetical protein